MARPPKGEKPMDRVVRLRATTEEVERWRECAPDGDLSSHIRGLLADSVCTESDSGAQ